MMKLYGCKGCGSAAIEAALQLLDIPFENIRWDWEDREGWESLAAINPLRQVPTLYVGPGNVLTESVAILLWLAEMRPESRYAPERGSPEYGQFLRWLVFLSANVYAPIGIGDFPERWLAIEAARASLRHGTIERSKAAWLLFESSIRPQPYLLGNALTFLDLYVAMLTRWRPGREWILEHCKGIGEAVAATEANPVIAQVWQDNF
jgi:GST-like protein